MTCAFEEEHIHLSCTSKVVIETTDSSSDNDAYQEACAVPDNGGGSDMIVLPPSTIYTPLEFFLPSLLHIPSSPETRFANELCSALGDTRLHDGWPSFVPRYLGHDRGVDAAAACMMKALQGVTTQSSTKAIEVACAPEYARALSILQSKLRSSQIRSGDFALLMAVLLVCVAWTVHPQGSQATRSHAQGANAIILALPPQKAPSELRRSVFLTNWLGTFVVPIGRGIASPYESKRWLECDTRLSGFSDDVASLTRLHTHLFIRLPRLVALVRKLKEGDRRPSIIQRAVQTAQLCARLQDWEAENRLLHQVTVKQTQDPRTRHITATSFHFRHRACWAEMCYWQTRILTDRLCLQLLDLGVSPSTTFDREKLHAENVRMAKNLIMSWEFGSSYSGLSMAALRLGYVILWSMTLSMGVFNKAVSIAAVRQWVRHSYNLLHQSNYLFTEADLDEAAELLAGGPLKGILVEFAEKVQY